MSRSKETVLLLVNDLYTSMPFVWHKSEYVIYVRRVQSRFCNRTGEVSTKTSMCYKRNCRCCGFWLFFVRYEMKIRFFYVKISYKMRIETRYQSFSFKAQTYKCIFEEFYLSSLINYSTFMPIYGLYRVN